MRNIEIKVAEAPDRAVLFKLLELYQHDLSDIWDQDVDASGDYGYPLDAFFTEQTHRAYLFTVNTNYAGCALVNGSTRFQHNEHWMAQFFVMKKYRGMGVGQTAARHIFDCIRGRWEVGQVTGNTGALAFWTKIISEYTANQFISEALNNTQWVGTLQTFDNTAPVGRRTVTGKLAG